MGSANLKSGPTSYASKDYLLALPRTLSSLYLLSHKYLPLHLLELQILELGKKFYPRYQGLKGLRSYWQTTSVEHRPLRSSRFIRTLNSPRAKKYYLLTENMTFLTKSAISN